MQRNTYRIALGGILSALAAAILFLGSIIPLATFVAPALAAVCVYYFCIEYTNGTAFMVYFVIAVLVMLIAPDKEMALLFTVVLGYFPILKSWTERRFSRPVSYIIKFAVFNVAVVGMYLLALYVFMLPLLAEEFREYSTLFILALLTGGNVALFLYDRALTVLAALYRAKIKPKLQK